MTTKIKNSMADMASIAADSTMTAMVDSRAGALIPAIASQAEAEAGTDNAKMMTALRTAQAITAGKVSYYTLTVTSGSGTWTTALALGMYYTTAAGNHRLRFNIAGSFSAGVTSATITIGGVVFNATARQAVAARGGSNNWAVASATANANSISYATGASDTDVSLSGDVSLNAKPSWA